VEVVQLPIYAIVPAPVQKNEGQYLRN